MLTDSELHAHLIEHAQRLHHLCGSRACFCAAQQGEMRERKHRVAGVDRLRFAPQLPDRRAAASQLIAVLDVIMDQREVVQQFDRRSSGQRHAPIAAASLTAQQREHGADAFAGTCAHCVPVLVSEAKVVVQHDVEQCWLRPSVNHSAHLGFDRREEALEGRGKVI